MIRIDDEYKLLSPYFYRDDMRPGLTCAFRYGDHICATDTRSLLMIRQDLLSGEYQECKSEIDIRKVIPAENTIQSITLNAIKTALDQCPQVEEKEIIHPEVPCDECDGIGQVYWEYHDSDFNLHEREFECPVCNGSGIESQAVYRKTGRTAPTDDSIVAIGEATFSAIQISRLVDTMDQLEISTATIVTLSSDSACLIRLADGIDIIIMPLCAINLGRTAPVISTTHQ